MKAVVFTLLIAALGTASACSGGGSKSPSTQTAATAVTAGASNEASTTAVPLGTPAPEFRVEIRPFREADDIEFPKEWNLVYATAPWGHGSGIIDIRRTYRLDGQVRSEVLYQRPDDVALRSVSAGPAPGPIVLSACRGEQCGYEGDGKTGMETTFLISRDGGVTWPATETRPGEWWVQVAGDDVFVSNPATWLPGQGTLVESLTGAAPFRMEYARLESLDGEVVRATGDGRLVTAAGVQRFAARLPENTRADLWVVDDRIFGNLYFTYGPPETPHGNNYFAEFDRSGRPIRVYGPIEADRPVLGRSQFNLDPYFLLGPDRLLVTANFVRRANCTADGLLLGSAPAIFDLRDGSLAFIAEFLRTTPEAPCGFIPGGAVIPLSLSTRYLWRVNAPGSCLNLRRGYGLTSEIITCVADGAFLEGVGAEFVRVDGVIWGALRLPGGENAWAAMEFVARDN